MTKAEWHAWRAKGIGSSDASAIMGASPYMTRHELWEIKTGRRPEPEENFAMRRGKRLEPKARLEYHKTSDYWLLPSYESHPTLTFALASLDGYNKQQSLILEIKCPGKDNHALAVGGIIPVQYRWQLVHQTMVTGARMVHYYSFNGTQGAMVPFPRNEALEMQLIEAETAFWECVVRDIPPK